MKCEDREDRQKKPQTKTRPMCVFVGWSNTYPLILEAMETEDECSLQNIQYDKSVAIESNVRLNIAGIAHRMRLNGIVQPMQIHHVEVSEHPASHKYYLEYERTMQMESVWMCSKKQPNELKNVNE